MGACYSKKAGQFAEAYSFPVRNGSPARLRKRSAMNRTAPYPRQSAVASRGAGGPPAHSFGFRRRPGPGGGGGGGGHRVQPVPPPPARRAATTPSSASSDSLLSTSSDANGNQRPAKRTLPRPLVARVKPRTSSATSSASNVNSASSTKSAASRASKSAETVSPRIEVGSHMDDSGVGTMQGSLSSSGSAVSTTDAGSPEEVPPPPPPRTAPLAEDETADIRDFQVGIQTGGATIALSVNIHKGANAALSRPQVTVHDAGGRARVTQIQRPGFGLTQPAGLTRPVSSSASRAGSAGGAGGAAGGAAVRPPAPAAAKRSPPPPPPPPPPTARIPGPDQQTVRSRVTRWEEKVDQVRRETISVPTARRADARSSAATATPSGLAGLRREMRQLTRDVATSPLRRPLVRDTGTCTDAHVGHGAHDSSRSGHAESSLDPLSPLASSESPESRAGAEDFIDDEIGDQPAFGAFGAESLSPGGFLEDVLGAGLSEPTSPPLPPLQITEGARDEYVRPFRLTPRPLPALTTLETPLRRWTAEAATSASERRQQMEERAEQLARRLGRQDGGEDTPLGTTYQRLGLPEPATPEPTSAPASASASALASAPASATTAAPGPAPAPASAPAQEEIPPPPAARSESLVEAVNVSIPVSAAAPAKAADSVFAGPEQPDPTPAQPSIRPRLLSDDVAERDEDTLSDLEARDEVLIGCRRRRSSWRRVSELRELTSPTDSLNSDDLMADFDKDSDDAADDDESLSGQMSRLQRMRLRTSSSTDTGRPSPDPATRLLRPPRQSSTQDADDWLLIDRDTYMYMAQDFTHTKTMLHKLRRLLQDAETTNPFEHSLQAGRRGNSVSSESQLSSIDGRRSVDGGADLVAENADLKRQVSALQQQVEEQARTIHLLQQQMGKYAASPPDVSSVATQASQVVTEDPHVITGGSERG